MITSKRTDEQNMADAREAIRLTLLTCCSYKKLMTLMATNTDPNVIKAGKLKDISEGERNYKPAIEGRRLSCHEGESETDCAKNDRTGQRGEHRAGRKCV